MTRSQITLNVKKSTNYLSSKIYTVTNVVAAYCLPLNLLPTGVGGQ